MYAGRPRDGPFRLLQQMGQARNRSAAAILRGMAETKLEQYLSWCATEIPDALVEGHWVVELVCGGRQERLKFKELIGVREGTATLLYTYVKMTKVERLRKGCGCRSRRKHDYAISESSFTISFTLANTSSSFNASTSQASFS